MIESDQPDLILTALAMMLDALLMSLVLVK